MASLSIPPSLRREWPRLIGLAVLLAPTSAAGADDARTATTATSADDSERIVVYGRSLRRPLGPASTLYLNDQQLNAAPRRTAEEMLRQVPGLTVVQHGSEGKGYQFLLRGFDALHGSDLELTVDGIPINEWSNVHAQGYLDLGFLMPEHVRSLTVTKGPFTLPQGPFAMAGSIEYDLGVPDRELGWRLRYTAGTTQRHRLYAGYSPPDEDGAQFVGLSATYDDGFGPRRGLARINANARLRLLGGPDRLELTAVALGGYADFGLPGTLRDQEVSAGEIDFYDAYDSSGQGRSGRGLLGLVIQEIGDRHQLKLTAYGGYRELFLRENFTGFLRNPIDGDRREQRQRTWSAGLSGQHHLQLASGLKLETGVGLRIDVLTQREEDVGQEFQSLSLRRDLEATQGLAHALVGLQYRPLRSFIVEFGVRLDAALVDVRDQRADGMSGEGAAALPSPRLTMKWQPNPEVALFGSYGRGFRPPEARAFVPFDGGPTGLEGEVSSSGNPGFTTSDAAELGAWWIPTSWLRSTLTGFVTFVDNEQVFDHVQGTSVALSGTRRLGAELLVEARPVWWLTVATDLTVVDAQIVDTGEPVPFAPTLNGAVRMTLNHPSGFDAGARLIAIGERNLPFGARAGPVFWTDLTLGYRWDRFRFDLEVENLFNQELREGIYNYASNWRRGETASELPVIHTSAGPPLNLRLSLSVYF